MKCPNCGAEMALEPSSGKLVCPYCDTALDPEAVTAQNGSAGADPAASAAHTQGMNPAQTSAARRKKYSQESAQEVDPDGDVYTATVYTCRSCGAELLVTDATAVTFCSYCGSQQVLRSRVESMRKPSFIIPFTQTKEDCEAAYRKMLRRSGFAPSEMTKDTTIEKFRGIYMPYWVYDMEADRDVRNFGSQVSRQGDWVVTRYYRVESKGHADYKGISFDASSDFADNLSQCIAPFDLRGSRNFDEVYLSGYYEDMADVDSSVYREDAEHVASAHVAERLTASGLYSSYGIGGDAVQEAVPMIVKKEQMGLFPVWFLGCRSADGKRISYAVVNGQTGKIAADLPMSFGKYLAGSALMAIPIFLLLNLFLTLTPTKALIGAVLLAAASILVSLSQLDEIYTRRYQLDDKGLWTSRNHRFREDQPVADSTLEESTSFLQLVKKTGFGSLWRLWPVLIFIAFDFSDLTYLFSAGLVAVIAVIVVLMVLSFLVDRATAPVQKKIKKKTFKMPFGEKQKHLFLQEIGILIPLVVLILDPPADIWYYGAAVIAMVLTVLSFYDLVKGHNSLTTRKLPQMGARGGDEYEMQ